MGKQGCLGKSTNMVNQLAAEKCEKISHIEVPKKLLHQGEKRQNTSTKEEKNQGPQAKKGKKDQGVKGGEEPKKPRVIHCWSTDLKEVFLKLLTEANYPSLYRICYMLLMWMYQGNPSPRYGHKGMSAALDNRKVHLWEIL